MNRLVIHRRSLVVLVVLAALLLPGSAVFAQNRNPGVIPPHATAHGKSYEGWAETWWQWVFAQPASTNPILDTTGEHCAQGQQGHVWFLGASFPAFAKVNRDCTIPTGTALFFPVLNGIADNNGESTVFTKEQLQARCDSFVDNPATLAVTVDGKALTNLADYRIDDTFFFYHADQSFLEVLAPPGVLETTTPAPGAASCGYYVMLTPLSQGQHTLHIQATFTDGTDAADATYNLTVVPAGHLEAHGAQADPGTTSADGGKKAHAAGKHHHKKGGQRRTGKHRH